ncbi:MAG TPA: glutathionylspermidine synthase family protein [Stellaceae bacterium]|nr:glutathionylspermidine synthase family protein [Stellaceae bacterium]
MLRYPLDPRPDWQSRLEALGFDFYRPEGVPYWQESACYGFTAAEIDTVEAAANELHGLCLQAVERIVSERLYPLLGIAPEIGRLIEVSWQRRDPAVYGRFDLVYDGVEPPKMLEYNADTPTSLFEAAIVQDNWREQVRPQSDQFNSLHEALVDRWRSFLVGRRNIEILYVTTATPNPEDETTVQYLGQTAIEAGWRTKFLPIQEIGWDSGNRVFVDLDGLPMRQVFKLYPWEWIMAEEFGPNVARSGANFIEPIWKMVLSNKGLLPILWAMFPEHENLLPAFRDPAPLAGKPCVRKPALGREGANIRITDGSAVLAESDGTYAESGYIYQAFVEPPAFDGNYANLGAWMIGDTCHGMGVREDDTLIMANRSRFVPHFFE